MSTYSVADAKATLPRLIDRAMAGEEVIITRHGKPVAQLRAAPAPAPTRAEYRAALERLSERRSILPGPPMSSVELLNEIYDDPES